MLCGEGVEFNSLFEMRHEFTTGIIKIDVYELCKNKLNKTKYTMDPGIYFLMKTNK